MCEIFGAGGDVATKVRRWVKGGHSPVARCLLSGWRHLHALEIPMIPGLHHLLYGLHRQAVGMGSYLLRVLYWTPLFKSRLIGNAPRLYLYGGMPCVLGSLNIKLGSDCRIAGMTTISGRVASANTPELIVGNNCDISWNNTIAVGRKVILGNNVRMAGRVFLAGYPGHPLEPSARAQGLADAETQVGDIVLDDDVWLATGVFVMAGVRIGTATIVAAGSVVTHDLPAGVLAAGSPARVIRRLAESVGA